MYFMKISAFGNDKLSIYQIMTELFPGVIFGEFYQTRDKKTLQVSKNSFWIKIEEEFFNCSSIAEFINFLENYKASGQQKTFEHLFPKDTYLSFSYNDLISKLKTKTEESILINDCRILNDKVFKGGLFLYCSRFLDVDFLANLISVSKENIYKELLQKYNTDQLQKENFPCSNLFNCSSRWFTIWECVYDYDEENNGNPKYRFLWGKDLGDNNNDWGLLNYYSPNNPYEFFVHLGQSQYTLVNIGKGNKRLVLADISDFDSIAKTGFKTVLSNLNYSTKFISFTSLENEEDFDAKYKNILMGIEAKDGAKKMTQDVFMPKDLDEVIRNVKQLFKNQKGLLRISKERYQLKPAECNEIYELFYQFGTMPEENFETNDLDVIKQQLEIKNVNKNPYIKVNMLNKYKSLLSEKEQKQINQLLCKLHITTSLDDLISRDDSENTVGDILSENDIKNNSGKRISRDYSLEKILIELLEDISSYFSQDTLFSKVDFSLLGRQMWNDYNNAKNKNLFLKMIIKKNIIDFDLTCSDKDFKQNYYVKVYQKNNKLTDIELLGFRELIFHLSLKLKKEYAEED